MADWDTRGNNIVGGDFLGTTNAQPLSIRTNNEERLLIGGGRTLEVRGTLTAGGILAGGNLEVNLNIRGDNIIARGNLDVTDSDLRMLAALPPDTDGNVLVPEAIAGRRGNLYFGGITDTNRPDQIGMRLFGGVVNRGTGGEVRAGFIDVKT